MSSAEVSQPLVSRWGADVSALRPDQPNFALPITLTPQLSLWRLIARNASLVYEGFDRRTGDRVAVKLYASLSKAEERARVLPEAARCGNLDHPALPKVLDASMLSDGTPYVVSEFAFGQSLTQCMREPLQPGVACDIASQVLSALQALHALPTAHGGVEPGNVFIEGERGRVQVRLVGAAMPFGRVSTQASRPSSSHPQAYWAPELLAAPRATIRADLYAVGLLLHEMLTGICPHAALTDDSFASTRASEPIDGRWLSQAGVSSGLARVVSTALAIDPHRRFISAQEMLCELHAARADESCLWRISSGPEQRIDRVAKELHSTSSVLPLGPLENTPAPQLAIDSSVWGVLPDSGGEHTPEQTPHVGGAPFRAWLVGFSATLVLGGILLAVVTSDNDRTRAKTTAEAQVPTEAPPTESSTGASRPEAPSVQMADSERPLGEHNRAEDGRRESGPSDAPHPRDRAPMSAGSEPQKARSPSAASGAAASSTAASRSTPSDGRGTPRFLRSAGEPVRGRAKSQRGTDHASANPALPDNPY